MALHHWRTRAIRTGFVGGPMLLAAVFLAWPTTARAQCSFVVDGAGGGSHTSIQAAIDELPNPGPCAIAVRAGVYRETVTIAGRNTFATADAQRIRLVADRGAVINPPGDHAFVIRNSRFITIESFRLTGALKEAVVLEGGEQGTSDVTLAANDIHNNGGAAANGGVLVGAGNARVWIVNNLVRQNGRNGITIESAPASSGVTYLVQNTVFGNGWNGVSVGRRAEVYVINNLIAGNGTDAGATGGRWGVSLEQVAGTTARAMITLMHNVLYKNGAGRPARQGGDLAPALILGGSDSGNYTTTGKEGPGAACLYGDCSGSTSFSALFGVPGFGPHFRLAAGAAALDRGLPSFVRDGKDWVPDVDFDGDRRPRDGDHDGLARPDIGYDERRS